MSFAAKPQLKLTHDQNQWNQHHRQRPERVQQIHPRCAEQPGVGARDDSNLILKQPHFQQMRAELRFRRENRRLIREILEHQKHQERGEHGKGK